MSDWEDRVEGRYYLIRQRMGTIPVLFFARSRSVASLPGEVLASARR